MKRAVAFVAAVLAIGAIGAGVWIWRTGNTGEVCDRFSETAIDGPGGGNYATVNGALVGFGGLPGIRGHIPPESIVPTDQESPEFGATISATERTDTPRERVYDIWKDGIVVQSVSLDRYSDGWAIGGYGGCFPIP